MYFTFNTNHFRFDFETRLLYNFDNATAPCGLGNGMCQCSHDGGQLRTGIPIAPRWQGYAAMRWLVRWADWGWLGVCVRECECLMVGFGFDVRICHNVLHVKGTLGKLSNEALWCYRVKRKAYCIIGAPKQTSCAQTATHSQPGIALVRWRDEIDVAWFKKY